jgi:hypothetical protein
MINKDELKKCIINFININNGCKTTEIKHYRDSDVTLALTKYNLRFIIDELIEENLIYIIKYILPDGSEKLFLLPSGSCVSLLNSPG